MTKVIESFPENTISISEIIKRRAPQYIGAVIFKKKAILVPYQNDAFAFAYKDGDFYCADVFVEHVLRRVLDNPGNEVLMFDTFREMVNWFYRK